MAHFDGSGFQTAIDNRIFEQPAYQVKRCRGCGLVYKSDIASASVLSEYYTIKNYRDWVPTDLFPTDAKVVLSLSTIPAGGRVLDFGCSIGRILSNFVKTHKCFGVEVNEVAAAEATKAGITILSAEAALDPGQPPFDAILLMDVFEHLSQPTELLASLARRLTPDGKLFIATGDADAPAIAGDPANFWYFRNIEHLCMITRQYAEYFAARNNLTLAGWDHVSHYWSGTRGRAQQWLFDLAYRVFHRGHSPLLKPVFSLTPRIRRARHWKERPVRNTTADHVVAVFTPLKSSSGVAKLSP